jgi:hypothetical protein
MSVMPETKNPIKTDNALTEEGISSLASLFDDVTRFVKNHLLPPQVKLEYCKPKLLAQLKDGETGQLSFDSFDDNSRFEVTDGSGKTISPNPFRQGDTPQISGPGSFTVHLITQGVANQGATGTAKLIKD